MIFCYCSLSLNWSRFPDTQLVYSAMQTQSQYLLLYRITKLGKCAKDCSILKLNWCYPGHLATLKMVLSLHKMYRNIEYPAYTYMYMYTYTYGIRYHIL